MTKLTFSGSAFLFVFLLLMFQTGIATDMCSSACGGTNISYPFRLQTDPISCGDYEYELSCENNFTVLNLTNNGGKYYVQAINYDNFTIRLVDASVDKDDCSSIPSFPLTNYYSFLFEDPYTLYKYKQNTENQYSWETLPAEMIGFVKCQNPVDSSSYLDTSPCINSSYSYVGEMKGYDLKDGCSLEMVSLMLPRNRVMSSFVELHREIAFGFELSWHNINCRNCSLRLCYLDNKDHFHCLKTEGEGISFADVLSLTRWELFDVMGFLWILLYMMGSICILLVASYLCGGPVVVALLVTGTTSILYRIPAYGSILLAMMQFLCMLLIARALCGTPCVAAFLIYKWRRRHLSGYNTIEEFLQTQNNLMPIRYAYSDIKKMTGGFKELLGKGGFGSVYKGKLRSGQFAAVKMLEKSKANGQDFINEVATIGRIHHANVVRLIGFCSEGSKHALVYEFMSNGSLDSHIFIPERSISLSWEKLYEISLGVARGIEYLHRGCDIQILHFDIKPHNILLDENFTPKVSDFGLAKLYPTRGSIASLTAARGTIGYMAPELFYKNIGRVSYKADVYSFGMLLLEVAGKRKNLEARGEDTSPKYLSQIYYPFLVYNKLSDGKLEIEGVTEEENEIVRKMIITGLWCIQMEPSNRPSMNKVVEMLEGNLESLQFPPKPLLCPAQDLPLLTTADFAEWKV